MAREVRGRPWLDDARRELEATGAVVHSVHVDLAQPGGVDELWGRVRATGRPLESAALHADMAEPGSAKD